MKCGLSNGTKCLALITKECGGCNFFKTAEQINRERKLAVRQLKRKGCYAWARKTYPLLDVLKKAKKH
jgi:hypothetical protein